MSFDKGRKSALAERHRALGSTLEDWNGMETAWTYSGKSVQDDHVAIRTKAGLMDVSGLKKLHVVGPDAAAVINHATTRNTAKIQSGRSVYACMLNEGGYFTEDCIIYHLAGNSWMVVHGTGSGHEELARSAVGKNVAILFDDNLHDISLQGPASVDFLAEHVPGIRDLRYFNQVNAQLFGRSVLISRTGYTGERGYELFVSAADVVHLWDEILDKGKPFGIVPAMFKTLDLLRVESYLLFYPDDNSVMYPHATPEAIDGDSLWELGLEFTVSPGKTGFRGAERHYALKGKERFKIFGVLLDSEDPNDTPEIGAEVIAEGTKVGVVTGPMYSTLTKRSMCIARLSVEYASHGKRLSVAGNPAMAHTLPFDDPDKKKRVAVG